MDEEKAAAHCLVELAEPFMARKDGDGLAEKLGESWSAECLRLLLCAPEDETVRVAAHCLGLIGQMSDSAALAEVLGHEQLAVVDIAEDALWSIWFRAGGTIAQAVLGRIARSVKDGETRTSAAMLAELIKSYPSYAEAHHQRGQAYYLLSEYSAALRDARRATELNPYHFAAYALVGHAQSSLGRYEESLKAYREALRIYPRMAGVRESIQHVRGRLASIGRAVAPV